MDNSINYQVSAGADASGAQHAGAVAANSTPNMDQLHANGHLSLAAGMLDSLRGYTIEEELLQTVKEHAQKALSSTRFFESMVIPSKTNPYVVKSDRTASCEVC